MRDRRTLRKSSFWDGKTPCWELRNCILEVCQTCPAYLDQSRPCWRIKGTLCKKLLDKSTCFVCEVYERYGSEEMPPLSSN